MLKGTGSSSRTSFMQSHMSDIAGSAIELSWQFKIIYRERQKSSSDTSAGQIAVQLSSPAGVNIDLLGHCPHHIHLIYITDQKRRVIVAGFICAFIRGKRWPTFTLQSKLLAPPYAVTIAQSWDSTTPEDVPTPPNGSSLNNLPKLQRSKILSLAPITFLNALKFTSKFLSRYSASRHGIWKNQRTSMFLIELLAKTQINVIHRCRMSKYSKVPPPIDVRRVGFVLFALLREIVLRIREVIWYLVIFFENLWNWSRLKVPFAEVEMEVLRIQAGEWTLMYFDKCRYILLVFFYESVMIQCSMPKLYFITMQLLDRLLEGIPEQDLKDFQSYSQLHLKHILTTINKNKLEDTTQAKIRKYQCFTSCYQYYGQQQTEQMLSERVEQLRTCKQKCGKELKEVEKFLDNINFYSKVKFQGCSKGCLTGSAEEKNVCLWECFNRLDRRYKQYWANQRTNVEAKHTI